MSRTKQSVDAIPAKVSYSHAVGPVVYVELKRDGTDEYLEAEISKEQFRQLSIQAGDVVYVQPKRSESVYSEDFVI
ncbi:TOBE-like domain-containing protein [Bacillus pacificus]